MKTFTIADFKRWGAQGGKKSRRTLTTEQAKRMNQAKANKRKEEQALTWKCDLGNGEWDHDWQEKHDDAGEVDGGPGDHWSWRECRVCGEIEAPNEQVKKIPSLTQSPANTP